MRRKRNKNKFSVLFFLLVVGTFIASTNIDVFATPNKENNKNEITIQAKDDPSEGIFSEKRDGLWQPGKQKTNDFIVKNQGKDEVVLKSVHFNQVKLTNSKGEELQPSDKSYSDFMDNSLVTILNNGHEVYRGELRNAFNDNGIKLPSPIKLASNDVKTLGLSFEILGPNAGNSIQGLKEEFKLAVTYEKDGDNNGGITNPDGNGGGTITPDSNGGTNTGLPTTGQLIGTSTLLLAGIILFLIGIGVIKGSKKEGEKNA